MFSLPEEQLQEIARVGRKDSRVGLVGVGVGVVEYGLDRGMRHRRSAARVGVATRPA